MDRQHAFFFVTFRSHQRNDVSSTNKLGLFWLSYLTAAATPLSTRHFPLLELLLAAVGHRRLRRNSSSPHASPEPAGIVVPQAPPPSGTGGGRPDPDD